MQDVLRRRLAPLMTFINTSNIVIMATNAQLQPTVRKSGGIYVQVKGRITMNYYCDPVPQLQGNFCDDHFQIAVKRTRMRNTDIVECCLQWNLQTTDTLGAGVLSTVERLSLSRRFANKPRPSILRSLIGIYY